MRLYVANLTLHRQDIHYRLDFVDDKGPSRRGAAPPPRKQSIEKGRQVCIGGDLHISQVEDIVSQLSRYGMIGEADLPQLRGKRYVPYVYNLDKHVSVAAMRAVAAHNKGVKLDEGADRREKAALAANEALVSKIMDEEPPKFEVEFEQLDVSELDESRIEAGFRIDHSAKPKPGPKAGRGARKQAA